MILNSLILRLNEEMFLPSLDQASDFPLSISPDLAPHTSQPTDVIEDVLISTNPPASFHLSRDFEEGEDLESASELNMSVTPEIEHCDLDKSKAILQETCVKILKATRLDFSNDILSIEYEYFSCGFDVNVGLDVDLCAECESFSFDPIRIDLLFGHCESEFVEFESIANKKFALD